MKRIANLVLALSILFLALSCQEKKEGPARFVGDIHDTILTAFPKLEAKKDFEDISKPEQSDYYLHQAYYLNDEESLFSGTLTNDHWNDSLKAEGTFKDGKVQQFTTWYPNGSKKSEMNLTPDDQQLSYLTTTWYHSGELQSEYNRNKGKRFYKSGKLKSEWDNSSATDYWENGNRQTFWPLDENTREFKLHGTWKAWHENGTLGIEGTYVEGKKDGRWIFQDTTGALSKVVIYNSGAVDTTITDPGAASAES